jgi:hypothetical protein
MMSVHHTRRATVSEHHREIRADCGRLLRPRHRLPDSSIGTRFLGFFHLGSGVYLMYPTFITALDFAAGYHIAV